MSAPLALPARPRSLSKLLPVAFLSLSLFFISEKQTQGQTPPTAPVVRGTLQIKRGASTTPIPALMPGQQYMVMPPQTGAGGTMDACDFDLYIGTPYGNRRMIQRFFTGQGAPGNSSNQGAILDMYLDKVTGLLYQKTAAGWGTGINLKGADGTNGTNGITPTIAIGTISTLGTGNAATATFTGTATAKILNFGLPVGATGLTGATGAIPNLTIGTVTPNFTSATPNATISGTSANPVLNLTFAAAPYTFMVDVPAIAAIEFNTNKTVTLTFPTSFPGTNYVYYVQFVSTSGGLISTLTWTQGAKTSTSLTLNVRSSVAVLGGSAQAWVMVAYKNAP